MKNEILYGYVRVSTSTQYEKDLSIPQQVEKGQKIADELGYDFIYFEEQGESASNENFDNRPQFQKFLNLIETDKAHHIYVLNQSRLSRNDATQSYIKTLFKKKRIVLYTSGSTLDFIKTEDVLIYTFIDVIESFNTDQRLKGFKRGIVSANRKGRFTKPIPPYGFDKTPTGELSINIEEANVIKMAAEWYLSEKIGFNKIANRLNDLGYKTKSSKLYPNGYLLHAGKSHRKNSFIKKGDVWNAGSLNSMFKNTVLCGKRKFSGIDDIEEIDCPQILDELTFQRIQTQRESNFRSNKRDNKYFYLLKGLIECEECGRSFYGRINHSKGENVYKCNSTRYKGMSCNNRGINIDKLNTIILEVFKMSDHYYQQLSAMGKNDQTLIQGIKSQLTGLKNEISRLEIDIAKGHSRKVTLTNKFLDGTIDEDVYIQMKNEINLDIDCMKTDYSKGIERKLNVENELSNEQKLHEATKSQFKKLNKNYYELNSLLNYNNKLSQERASEILLSAVDVISVKYDIVEKEHSVTVHLKPLNAVDSNFPSSGKPLNFNASTKSLEPYGYYEKITTPLLIDDELLNKKLPPFITQPSQKLYDADF